MKIKAKRDFVNISYGNINKGDIVDVSYDHGTSFIESGLAELVDEVKKDRPVKEDKKDAFFQQPTTEETHGSASPAAPATKTKTERKSKSGKVKVLKKGKSRS